MENINDLNNEFVNQINESLLSKTKVDSLVIYCGKSILGDSWQYSACLEIKDGDTKTEKRIKGNDFEEVVFNVKKYLNGLSQNKEQFNPKYKITKYIDDNGKEKYSVAIYGRFFFVKGYYYFDRNLKHLDSIEIAKDLIRKREESLTFEEFVN